MQRLMLAWIGLAIGLDLGEVRHHHHHHHHRHAANAASASTATAAAATAAGTAAASATKVATPAFPTHAERAEETRRATVAYHQVAKHEPVLRLRAHGSQHPHQRPDAAGFPNFASENADGASGAASAGDSHSLAARSKEPLHLRGKDTPATPASPAKTTSVGQGEDGAEQGEQPSHQPRADRMQGEDGAILDPETWNAENVADGEDGDPSERRPVRAVEALGEDGFDPPGGMDDPAKPPGTNPMSIEDGLHPSVEDEFHPSAEDEFHPTAHHAISAEDEFHPSPEDGFHPSPEDGFKPSAEEGFHALATRGRKASIIGAGKQPIVESLFPPPLDLDFDKEDKPYECVVELLDAYPILADQPIWNLVNPIKLKNQHLVLETPFGSLGALFSPQGVSMSAGFPKMRLRDLPVFEWLPEDVPSSYWSEPIETSLAQYTQFFPDLMGHMALQDLRMSDLLLVATRKRQLWTEQFKAMTTNMTSGQQGERINELLHLVEKAKSERDEARGVVHSTEQEYDTLFVSNRKLRKHFEEDQELIKHQQSTLSEEGKLVGSLDIKLTVLEATRKEQHAQLERTQEVMMNLTHISEQAKRVTRQQDQELMKLQMEKESLKRRTDILEHQLTSGGTLEMHQTAALKAERTRGDLLRTELNATLAEETAEQDTNKDLEREVAALRAERGRLLSTIESK